jgi:eukaryotic-like serine/threonine-protein kinase
VMELLHGRDLGQTVEEDGRMHPAEVAALGVVLSDALQYLAGQGVVRLDLKPNNVIMAARGPVIVDLGIAVRPDAGAAITQMNQIVGTPAYMAPEMVTGGPADQRSDQYSLALVLYFCLAGRGPWDDLTNAVAILSAVVSEPADCSRLPVSAEFQAALSRALAKAPADRFPDAAAFSAALKATPEWRSLGADAVS